MEITVKYLHAFLSTCIEDFTLSENFTVIGYGNVKYEILGFKVDSKNNEISLIVEPPETDKGKNINILIRKALKKLPLQHKLKTKYVRPGEIYFNWVGGNYLLVYSGGKLIINLVGSDKRTSLIEFMELIINQKSES